MQVQKQKRKGEKKIMQGYEKKSKAKEAKNYVPLTELKCAHLSLELNKAILQSF